MTKKLTTTRVSSAKSKQPVVAKDGVSADYAGIYGGIVALLEQARRAAARSINALMTASYWEIGRRIVEFEQGGKERADYGSALLKRLSADLTARFGRGFGVFNLQQMRLFYLAWPTGKIYWTLSNKFDLSALAKTFPLPWSAYVRLLSVRNEHARTFYEAEVLRGGWSVRQLDRKIGSQFKVMAAEYLTALPDENLLAGELEKTRQILEAGNPGRTTSRTRKIS